VVVEMEVSWGFLVDIYILLMTFLHGTGMVISNSSSYSINIFFLESQIAYHALCNNRVWMFSTTSVPAAALAMGYTSTAGSQHLHRVAVHGHRVALIVACGGHAADVIFLPCPLLWWLRYWSPANDSLQWLLFSAWMFFWLLLFFLATFVSPLFKITKTVAMD
jgi:hypothetical protein